MRELLRWFQRHRIVSLTLITALFATALTLGFTPGVEKVIPQLQTDSAVAGKQFKYQCQIPSSVQGPEKVGGRWGYSSWQPTRELAKLSALADAARGKFRVQGPNWVDGSFDLLKNGQVMYTFQAKCRLVSTRWKSTR